MTGGKLRYHCANGLLTNTCFIRLVEQSEVSPQVIFFVMFVHFDKFNLFNE